MSCKDGKSSDYCAAGLAYRVYQTIQKTYGLRVSEKNDNAVAVMACIGTLADTVNVADVHSYNRQIIKDGMARINNADVNNLDFLIGYMLTKNGFGLDDCTSHDIALFSAFLNSGGRCSEYINANGAQMTYDAISGEESLKKCQMIDKLCEINQRRKGKVDEFVTDKMYNIFVVDELTKKLDTNICVYLMPENSPTAFCGLIASKLCSAINKAAIVLTCNTKKDIWTGSAKNVEGQSGIYKFMQEILEKPEAKSIDIDYAGNSDALEIKRLNNAFPLINLIEQYHDLMKSAPAKMNLLGIEPRQLNHQETLQTLKSLEPVGNGFEIPYIRITGTEKFRDKNFISKNGVYRKDWKVIKIFTEDKELYTIKDWSYNSVKIPQRPLSERKNEISVIAKMSLECYKGSSVSLTAVFDRNFHKYRLKEIEESRVHESQIER